MPKLKASVLTCWKYCNILYIRQTVLKHSELWLYIFIITIIIIFDRRSDRAQVNWIQLYITCSSMPRWNHRNPPRSPDSMNKEEKKKKYKEIKPRYFAFHQKSPQHSYTFSSLKGLLFLFSERTVKIQSKACNLLVEIMKAERCCIDIDWKNHKGIFNISLSSPG